MSRNNRILEQIRQNPKLVVSDDFEIAVFDRETKRRSFLNGLPHGELSQNQTWVNLRLVQRKAPGFASVSGDTKEALQYLIECGSRASDASKVDPWFRFPLWRAQAIQHKLDLADMTKEEEDSTLQSRYSTLSKKPFGFFEEHQIETERVTLFRKQEKQVLSKGKRTFKTNYNLSLQKETPWFQAEKTGTQQSGDENQEMLAELLGSAIQMASSQVYDGELPTRFILSPRIVSTLLKENETFFLASSPPGETVMESGVSEALTFIDDGTEPFDMEGSISEKTVVVEKGSFKTLLHNTQTATKENRLSTGNFVLGPSQKFPRVGFTNFHVEPGPVTDLVGLLEDGFFLDRIESIERRRDESTQFWMSGFRIRGGKLIESLRRVPLIFSFKQFLRDAQCVGQDLEFFGNTGSPSILFEKKP